MSISRRQVLVASGSAAGVVALAACGGSSGSASTTQASTPASSPAESSASASASGSSSGAAGVLAKTADVPVGGGVIVESDGAPYVVTQPVSGTFRCFSGVCTHQGCTVNAVEGGTINCPCHGGKFSVDTGDPVSGPPKQPLGNVPHTVTDGAVVLA